MNQLIWCPKCRDESSIGKIKYPGEGTRVVDGKALRDFRCDSCNNEIKKNEKCFAASMFKTGCYVDWEREFIEF